MELKELGATGVMIPEIGLGTWRYRGGTKPLRAGIDLGASLIDTAEGYGAEEIVGKAVSGIRDRVFIATKVSGRDLGHDRVLRAAEESLRRLGTDFIDLYQVHWPNSRYPMKETMRAMETLVDRGMIRYIGVSNFNVDEMEEAISALRNNPLASNQVIYNLNTRGIEEDVIPYCIRHNITVMAYTPLDDGSLAGGFGASPGKMAVLEEIAEETGKTMAQVALNWCTSGENVIAIPKSNTLERTVENCGASGWRLTPGQKERLDAAFVGYR
ncbi:MAG TPA: aldo/keto reductase [Thermodesulfobacteriota bacterium]|nr:aldo/keto reductase [Thermodesulfobacteriota bacterium]